MIPDGDDGLYKIFQLPAPLCSVLLFGVVLPPLYPVERDGPADWKPLTM